MPPNNPFLNQPAPGQTQPVPTTPQQPTPPPIPQQPIPGASPTPAPGQPQMVTSGQAAEKRPTPKNPNSTQNTLQLSELRDNMVIMADGSFRAVIKCDSINFDLMSDRERGGVEYSYQQFLNSLNFPVQILIRSQRVDIGPYLDKLVDTRRSQDNMLLGVLMDDYINFIDFLAQEANIMEKSFYIVVPYFPQGNASNLIEQGKGFFGKLLARPKNTITKIDSIAYAKAKEEIKNHVDSVLSGLFQMGVQGKQLDTKALGELYYSYYNPDTAIRQPLTNFENATSTFVMGPRPTTPPPAPGGTV